MAQTLRNTNDIITRAFYLIGEFTPDETPSASQINEGLYYLNDLLDSFSQAGVYIPFIKDVHFDMVVGQDEYTFSNTIDDPDVESSQIIELDFVNIQQDNNISWPVRIITPAELLYNTQLLNLNAIPNVVMLNRRELYSILKFYPAPQQAFGCTVRAKFMLDHLELYEEITQVPRYYYRFLRYALARELLNVYPSSNWTEQSEGEYQKMLQAVTVANDVNVMIEADITLMRRNRSYVSTSAGIIP